MAQATFSIRMDEQLKREFDVLCNDFGMNATTAFNIFARAVVRERRIPFEIVSPEPAGQSQTASSAIEEKVLQTSLPARSTSRSRKKKEPTS